MNDLCFASATDLARLIATREVSSTEVTRVYLDRIQQHDAHLRTFITVDAERALAAAQAADEAGGPKGPLHGVPIGVKDNIATRDLRTTGGSRVLAEWVPDHGVDGPAHLLGRSKQQRTFTCVVRFSLRASELRILRCAQDDM